MLARRRRRLPGRRPWERQPREPAPAYAQFRVYLGLGPSRSLAKASEQCGLSLSRLKQLSGEGNWLFRALAWDRDQFLQCRRRELQACQETRERLLKESGDLQRIAGLEFRSWVRRDEAGQLQLVRQLSASEAVRLWQVGAEALQELQGPAVAAAYEQTRPKPNIWGEHPLAVRMREATEEAAGCICDQARDEVEEALLRVIAAWGQYYSDRHPDPDSLSAFDSLWPWDLPYADA